MEGSNDIGARQYFEKADFFIPELLLKELHMMQISLQKFAQYIIGPSEKRSCSCIIGPPVEWGRGGKLGEFVLTKYIIGPQIRFLHGSYVYF